MAIHSMREAAQLALLAPSIFNSQPWRWVLSSRQMQLRADRSRQLPTVDPDRRLLTISCGVALHHARLVLAGQATSVAILPNPGDPDLLATIQLAAGDASIPAGYADMLEAIRTRRTDRRTYTQRPVDQTTLAKILAACAAEQATLHIVDWMRISELALAALRAGALQLSTPEYRTELIDWTHRPPWSGDGVPVSTAVDAVPRSVPVRDFAPFDPDTLKMALHNDLGATYGIIHTIGDSPLDWLHAGQALSAVLLTATTAGLGTAPISDVTEVDVSRDMLRGLITSGEPQLAVRFGHPQPGEIPPVPRRPAEEVIIVQETEPLS